MESILDYEIMGNRLWRILALFLIILIALFVKELGGKNLALIIAGAGFISAGAFSPCYWEESQDICSKNSVISSNNRKESLPLQR